MGPDRFRRIPSAKEFKKIGQHLVLATAILASSASSSDAQSTPKVESLSNTYSLKHLKLVSPVIRDENKSKDQATVKLSDLQEYPDYSHSFSIEDIANNLPSNLEANDASPIQLFTQDVLFSPDINNTPITDEAGPDVANSRNSTWDRLAQCESSGNWEANTGNGHFGGLQFTLTSWQAVGGSGLPSEASREEQIERAERLKEMQGPGAWPVCSKIAGLR